MDEFLELLRSYTMPIVNITSPEGWAIAGLGTLAVAMYAYFNSQTYLDRVMGKSSIRAKHKAQIEQDIDRITEAFESAVLRGKMTREDADKFYTIMRKGNSALKELGPEPSFGKPWYYGPSIPKGAKEVKGRIIERLMKAGKSTHEIWNARKRISFARAMGSKSASKDMADLMKSIRSKPNA